MIFANLHILILISNTLASEFKPLLNPPLKGRTYLVR